jgi:hypothetical protein
MVVSGEHVRALWQALHDLDAGHNAVYAGGLKMDVTERLRRYKRDRSGYAEYCHQAADEIDRLRKQRDFLLSAARRTLAENAHLADGDVCTLIVLKRAVETLEEVGAGRTADSGHNLNSPTPIDG